MTKKAREQAKLNQLRKQLNLLDNLDGPNSEESIEKKFQANNYQGVLPKWPIPYLKV